MQALILGWISKSFKNFEKKLFNWKKHFTFTKLNNTNKDISNKNKDLNEFAANERLDQIIEVINKAYTKTKNMTIKNKT